MVLGAPGLVLAGLAAYWDFAFHIRGLAGEGFLAPAHVALYVGYALVSVATLGGIAADRAATRSARPVEGAWGRVRPGLVIAAAGVATSAVAAPFDVAWHRVFGLDVTIWSPPHLMAIAGIALAVLGLGLLVAPAAGDAAEDLDHMVLGGLLVALVLVTAEFEFARPPFHVAWHPIILTGAATLVLTAATRIGRWHALKTALVFQVFRLASVGMLVAFGRALPVVPVVLVAAIALDLLERRPRPTPLVAAVVTAAVIAPNLALQPLLGGTRWDGSALLLGCFGAYAAAIVGVAGGRRLGDVMVGATTSAPAASSPSPR